MSPSLRRLACITAILGSMAIAPLAPATAASFDDGQRKEIGEIVKDYLLKNPQVLQDVMVELEKMQQEEAAKAQDAALEASKDAVYDTEHGIVAGNPNGTATIVEFFDYNCGYCKRAVADIADMLKSDPNLKVILRDLPVLGQDSLEASQVALAVKQQLSGDKLFQYHFDLLHSSGRVDAERAQALAKTMGVDMDRLKKDMASPAIKAALKENIGLGDKLGLSGTPAFIVGNAIIPGAIGKRPLEQMVSNTRKCGKAAC